jgi:Domain of unknown function (DUF5671)
LIEKALAAGMPHQTLVGILTARGWPEKDVYNALADHYERVAGLEIPPRTATGASAKDAFSYLLIFSTLATWTIGLGWLAFAFIDRWLPDPLFSANSQGLDTYTITSSLAAVIVSFPLFLLISRAVAGETAIHPEKFDSPIRKWLTYLALVLAACVLMGDLIAALTYLLRGELTSRFMAKAFVVLAISGGVFSYYFGGLRMTDEPQARTKRDRLTAGICSAVVVAMVIVGFFQLGAPARQREMRADRQRVGEIYQLSNDVDNYWETHGSQLPIALEQLPGGRNTDPQTHAPYIYLRGQGSQYQLCATFVQNSEGVDAAGAAAGQDQWAHPGGYHCFQLDAKVRMPYPPQFGEYYGNS